MYILLYVVAGMSVVIGSGYAIYTGSLGLIGNGGLAAVLFGSLGKIVHLLSQIEGHLASKNEQAQKPE